MLGQDLKLLNLFHFLPMLIADIKGSAVYSASSTGQSPTAPLHKKGAEHHGIQASEHYHPEKTDCVSSKPGMAAGLLRWNTELWDCGLFFSVVFVCV